MTDGKHTGQYDGIETISLKKSDSGVDAAQNLTIDATTVKTISDHQITLGSVIDEHAAVKIDMDAVDQLYLSITKDGGTWADSGKHTTDGYEIFQHTAAGGGVDAYVMVATPDLSHVVLNKDAPTT